MVLIEPFLVAGKLFPPRRTLVSWGRTAPRKSKLSHLNAAPRQRGLFVLVEPRGGGYIYPTNLSPPLFLAFISFVLLFIRWAALSSQVFFFSFFLSLFFLFFLIDRAVDWKWWRRWWWKSVRILRHFTGERRYLFNEQGNWRIVSNFYW